MKLLIRKKKVFIRFLASYIIILLIPFILGTYVYSRSVGMLKEDAENLNLTVLRQGRDQIDRYLSAVDNAAKQVVFNTKINRMIYIEKPVSGVEAYNVSDVVNDMDEYRFLNDFIIGYYVFLEHPDIILVPGYAYTDSKLYFQKNLMVNKVSAEIENIEYQKWKDSVLGKYYTQDYQTGVTMVTDAGVKPAVAYLQSIPVSNFNNYYKGVIAFLIDETKIHNLLSQLYIKNGGWFYIIDPKGNIVTSSFENNNKTRRIEMSYSEDEGTKDILIGKDRMIVSYVTSPSNGWKYVAILPFKAAMGRVEYIKRVTSGIISIILIIGILVAFLLSYQNSQPIRNLIKVISKRMENGVIAGSENEYDVLDSTIKRLFDDNEYLRGSMKQQIPFLRTAFFYRLVKGNLNSQIEINKNLAHIGIEVTGELFTIVLIRLKTNDVSLSSDNLLEIEKFRIITKNILKNMTAEMYHMQDMDDDKIMLLLESKKDEEDGIKDKVLSIADKVISQLPEVYSSNILFGVGNTCKSLLNVYKSYKEAQCALEFIRDDRNKIIWFSQMPDKKGGYFYPIEMEVRLINLVKSGHNSEMKCLIKEIYNENYVKRKLPSNIIKQLINEIYGTISKLKCEIYTDSIELNNYIKELEINMSDVLSGKDQLKSVIDTFDMMCSIINQQRQNNNNSLEQRVIEYVSANYSNSQLTLGSIASMLGVNENYLSFYFKQQTDENFSTYLRRIRINHAYQILLESNLAINIVAEQVGYSSDQTFRRAFKHVAGMQPSQFKKDHNRTDING